MAEYTRQLVKQNKCEEVVTVLQGRAEEIELPEQVDILVSEWMGNCLLVIMTLLISLLPLMNNSVEIFRFFFSRLEALCHCHKFLLHLIMHLYSQRFKGFELCFFLPPSGLV